MMTEENTAPEGTEETEGQEVDPREESTDEVQNPAALLKAYEAEKAKRRELAQKVRDMESQKPDPDPTDVDAIRAEAAREANAKVAQRIIRTEVKAAAKGRVQDVDDALAFIDLSQFDVDDDGAVNETDINDAIEDLLKRKPYLAAQAKRFQDSADGGSRNDSSKRAPEFGDLIRALVHK
jgi:hypothetical protein